jgi:hypothetical protein
VCELLNGCLDHVCRIDTRRDAAAFTCVYYALDCSLWKTLCSDRLVSPWGSFLPLHMIVVNPVTKTYFGHRVWG